MTCPGSNIILAAPEGTTDLACPHCARRIEVRAVGVYMFPGQPQWRVRSHQDISRGKVVSDYHS